ncbi:MAG: phosphoribosylformylglycinamidine cyclo-ligase, partial [Firmicutes bacterium]|nr:phosphoribosylformylglycinamidine cyclo-ligase [Bacillota bacterium]
IVKGVAEGCVRAGCALIGGETAEHPGMMPEDEYDIAGYTTGVVDKSKIIDNSRVKEGDVVVGLASTGVHSNGFSLVRKIFDITAKEALEKVLPDGKTLGETLLTPTEIYVKPVLDLISKVDVKAVSHITGGGFYENVPRSLPEGFTARINKSAYEVPYIFRYMEEVGQIPERDMYNTFNMGIGMTAVVPENEANKAVEILRAHNIKAYCIGEIVKGGDGIEII